MADPHRSLDRDERNLLGMSPPRELRRDPVTGRVAIVAAGRAARPHTVASAAPEQDAGPEHCPFCPGHEHMTPPEVCRLGDGAPDTPGWRVRVVPNLYPIVDAFGLPGARGAHEVVVLSPDHRASFGQLDDTAAIEVLRVLRDRAAAHLASGLASAAVLVNHRRAAGASIAHPHAQIVSLDATPPEVEAAERWAAAHVDDVLATDLDLARGVGSVLDDGEVAAWFPHAAGSPFTVRLAHRSAPARFDQTPDAELDACALALRDTLARLREALADPPYNVTVHSADVDQTGVRRWYAEITPRISVQAGFEMATGILVNTTPAEQAIAVVRAEGR